jgi:prepilin-type N-terminal cleavage/methylation domain-containing protein
MAGKMRRAFTLIELLVVVTIFSIIAFGVGACFMCGMKLWQRVGGTDFFQYEVALELERFSQELFESLKFPLIGFEGEKEKLTFPTLRGTSIVEVTYEFDSLEESLIRKERTLRDFFKDSKDYSERKVLSAQEMNLKYFYFDYEEEKYKWKDTWLKEEGYPLGVKIELKNKHGEFQKKIFLPIS